MHDAANTPDIDIDLSDPEFASFYRSNLMTTKPPPAYYRSSTPTLRIPAMAAPSPELVAAAYDAADLEASERRANAETIVPPPTENETNV